MSDEEIYSVKDSESNNKIPFSNLSPSLGSESLLLNYTTRNSTKIKNRLQSKFVNKHLLRKQELLKMRTQKLKERSISINKRISMIKEHDRAQLKAKEEKLRSKLSIKKCRRECYLNNIRAKARNFQRNLIASKSVYSVNSMKSIIKERSISKEYNDYLSQVILIQRKVRKYLLQHNIKELFATGFLETFHKLSFNQCIKLMQTSSIQKMAMVSLLCNFEIPDLFNNKYSSFFYAFILICDYEDALKKNLHPGFNTNLDDKNGNLQNNFLWLLLYKLAKEMISCFQKLIRSPHSQKLKVSFGLVYNRYLLLFKIFKNNHFKRIIKLLGQSINIAQKHVDITNDKVIMSIKDNLLRENNLLKSYKKIEVDISADINDDDFFKNLSLISMEKTTIPQFKYHYIDNMIRFENKTFILPLNLTSFQWRKYFYIKNFNYFSKEENIPAFIVSGLRNIRHNSNLDIDEILRKLNETTNARKFAQFMELDFKQMILNLIDITNNDFQNLIKYVHLFHSNTRFKDNDRILAGYNYLRNTRINDLSDAQLYLQQLFSLIISYLEFNNLSQVSNIIHNCLQELYKEDLTVKHLIQLTRGYSYFKKKIDNLWIEKCKFVDFRDFKIFENIFIYVTNNNMIRSSLYTNSPSLKFPRFYEFLYRYDYTLNLNHYLKMFDGATSLPNIAGDQLHVKSYNYFQRILLSSIINGDLINNELNTLYLDDIKECHKNMQILIDSNTTLVLLLNFYSLFSSSGIFLTVSPRLIFKKIYHEYNYSHPTRNISFVEQIIPQNLCKNIEFSDFRIYHLKFFLSIKKILQKKLNELFNMKSSGNTTDLIARNFKYCYYETQALCKSIRSVLGYIYRLYGPTLDWIYTDIGEPDTLV